MIGTQHAQRGTMLVPVTFMVLLMAGLAGAFLLEAQSEAAAVTQHENNLYALQTAETGLAQAELEIFALKDTAADGIGTVSGTLHQGDFEATHLGDYVTTATKSPNSNERWIVRAEGRRHFSVRRIEIGVRRRGDGAFMEGLFSRDTMTINGGLLSDSFDSSVGSYASQAVNTDIFGTYANPRGHLGSNAHIEVGGTAVAIRGNAIAGVFHNTLTSGAPLISGDTLPRTENIDLPDPTLAEFEAAYTNNNNAAAFPGGGGKNPYDSRTMSVRVGSTAVVTLPAGTYFFSDFTLTAQAQLVTTGKVKIYVTGSFDLGGGGLINQTGAASDVSIISHPYPFPTNAVPKSSDVKITGGPSFTGTVYAPAVPLTLGGGTEFYGAVVGKTISLNGGVDFHYDEALGVVKGRSKVVIERIYWRDVSKPTR